MPLFVAGFSFAVLGLCAYFVLKWRGYHSRKNTFGVLLALGWFGGTCYASAPHGALKQPRRAQCLSNLKQIGLACHLYAEEKGRRFPLDLGALYHRYASDPLVFTCPSVEKYFRRFGVPPGDIGGEHLTYCYVSGLGMEDPPDFILAFDEEWNHGGDGVNVLRVDGRVEWTKDIGEMQRRLREQKETLRAKGRDTHTIRPSWSQYPDKPVYPVSPRRTWLIVGAVATSLLIICVALVAVYVHKRRRSKAGERAS